MNNPKRGLGRGLGALIPTAPATPAETGPALAEIAIDAIGPNPRQPRQNFDPTGLQELADSIREHGLIQPLVVTRGQGQQPAGGPTYTIIAGERRWRAARLAGLQQVPAVIKEASDQALLELALVENVQRADLNPLEEATAYKMLVDEFGLTQAQVATRMGKARVTVTNALRLLRLSEPVKEALISNKISEAHARALLGLEEEDLQVEALTLVLRRSLTVRQTEELVRRLLIATSSDDDEPVAEDDPQALYVEAMQQSLRERLGTKVDVNRNRRGRGRLVIHFYSDEELQSVYDAILGEST
jgi:ParB family chromosome partitioning protein